MFEPKKFRVVGDEVIFHLCPFCGNESWNFQVNKSNGKYHCWVCDTGGTGGWHFIKGLPIQDIGEPVLEVKESEYPQVLSMFDDTPNGRLALAYARSRGLSQAEIQRYIDGYTDSGRYEGRIIFRLCDIYGEPAYWVGRSFMGWKPKYLNPVIDKDQLFGFFDNIAKPEVLVVEGVTDGIAWKRIVDNVVVMLGKGLKEQQAEELVSRFTTITVIYDKGVGAEVQRLWNPLRERGVDVRLKGMSNRDADESSQEVLNAILDTGKLEGEVDMLVSNKESYLTL